MDRQRIDAVPVLGSCCVAPMRFALLKPFARRALLRRREFWNAVLNIGNKPSR